MHGDAGCQITIGYSDGIEGKFGSGRRDIRIRSLTSDDFGRLTSTGNGLFAPLSRDFEKSCGQIVSIRVKTLSHTNLEASRHIKREKPSLPVGIRRPKTLLL